MLFLLLRPREGELYDTIQYDTCSKADISQLNPLHGTNNKRWKKRNLKSKTDELRSIGKKLCDEHVCMCMSVRQFVRPSICLSVCDNISGTIRPYFTNFLCMLTMAIVRSSSGWVAIYHTLPGLWMMSCLQLCIKWPGISDAKTGILKATRKVAAHIKLHRTVHYIDSTLVT